MPGCEGRSPSFAPPRALVGKLTPIIEIANALGAFLSERQYKVNEPKDFIAELLG